MPPSPRPTHDTANVKGVRGSEDARGLLCNEVAIDISSHCLCAGPWGDMPLVDGMEPPPPFEALVMGDVLGGLEGTPPAVRASESVAYR